MSGSITPEGVRLGRNGRSLVIPGWLIASVSIVGSIFTAGWLASGQFQELVEEQRWTNYRLCRLEVTQGRDPWPSCLGLEFRETVPEPGSDG